MARWGVLASPGTFRVEVPVDGGITIFVVVGAALDHYWGGSALEAAQRCVRYVRGGRLPAVTLRAP